MALEELQVVIYPIIDIFAILATIFAIILLLHIHSKKKKHQHHRVLTRVFGLLAVGYIFSTLAELTWDALVVLGRSPELTLPDLFWVISSILFFITFTYFLLYMYKQSQKLTQGITLLVVVGIVAAVIVATLVSTLIIGQQEGESGIERFLDFYYPIISALIVTSTTAIYLFFKDFKALGRPLLLLAISGIALFIGDMLYTYTVWNEIYGIVGVLSDSFYGIQYLLAAIAFYMLIKNWVLAKDKGGMLNLPK